MRNVGDRVAAAATIIVVAGILAAVAGAFYVAGTSVLPSHTTARITAAHFIRWRCFDSVDLNEDGMEQEKEGLEDEDEFVCTRVRDWPAVRRRLLAGDTPGAGP